MSFYQFFIAVNSNKPQDVKTQAKVSYKTNPNGTSAFFKEEKDLDPQLQRYMEISFKIAMN